MSFFALIVRSIVRCLPPLLQAACALVSSALRGRHRPRRDDRRHRATRIQSCLSVCLSVCLPACLSVCLSVCHSPMGGTGSWIKPQVQTCAPSWRGLCECSLVPADGQCDSAPRPPLHPSQIPRHCSTSCCTNRRFQGTPAPQHGQSFLAALAAHPAPQAHSLAQGCSGGRGS